MSTLSLHSKAALLVPVLVAGWLVFQSFLQKELDADVAAVTIGIEHTQPASIEISSGIVDGEQIMDITNDSSQPIAISLPEDWQRDEVRGTTLAAFTSDPPALGFRRWNFPAGASVTFRTEHYWKTVTIHNPSHILLNVKVQSVDLADGTVVQDAYLMQEDPLTLHF